MAAWNPEDVRSASLEEGELFKPSIVMVMEDSGSVSEYADYLAQAAGSGIRPKFVSIEASDIAKKIEKIQAEVSKPRISVSGKEIAQEPMTDTIDLCAEAIKHSLLSMKSDFLRAQSEVEHEEEITGARSKDDLKVFNPFGPKPESKEKSTGKSPKDKKDKKKKGKGKAESSPKGKSKGKSKSDSNTEATTDGESTDKKGKSKTGTSDDETTEGTSGSKKKGKGKGGKGKKDKEKKGSKKGQKIKTTSLPFQYRKTVLRRRGEPKIPPIHISDDSPKDGPQLYVLLHGFYDPDIIDALNRIGVTLDGILLLTRNKVEKRNFSVIDIEENFPGTFQPQNILPNLSKYLEDIQDPSLSNEARLKAELVSKFWKDLSKKLNKAAPDSFIHDIALLNCELPPVPANLITPEELGFYSVQLLEEAAKRIFEMNILKNWHKYYQEATTLDPVRTAEPMEEPGNTYNGFMNRVPSECVTIPSIMESLLAQVVQGVEDEQKNNEKLKSSNEASKPKKSKSSKVVDPDKADGSTRKRSRKSKTSLKKEGTVNELSNQDTKKLSRKTSRLDNNPSANISQQALLEVANQLTQGVRSNMDFFAEEEETLGEYPYSFNYPRRNKYNMYYSPYLSSEPRRSSSLDVCTPTALGPIFQGPLYIKTNDFASIRTCHLDEEVAAIVAAAEVCGDFSGIRNILWDGMPDFQEHLFLKLRGNLTQFMQYIPAAYVDLKDMFFIIHLLLAAGVEMQLQKEALAEALKDVEENCPETDICCDRKVKKFRGLMSIYENAGEDDDEILNPSENYSTLSTTIEKARVELLEGPSQKLSVVTFKPEEDVGESYFGFRSEQSDTGAGEPQKSQSKMSASFPTEPSDSGEKGTKSLGEIARQEAKISTTARRSQKLSRVVKEDLESEKVHAAVISAGKIIQTAAQLATDDPILSELRPVGIPQNKRSAMAGGSRNEHLSLGKRHPTGNGDCKIMGETNWNENVKNLTALQAIVNCPALLAISDSGALQLSKWIETYLFCTGLKRAAGEGAILGKLRDWNFAEELVPVQMIQALSDATHSFLCMERIYCPFYDTVLFIFNDPTPSSLQAESSFVLKLDSSAGIQHFLEYTINDRDVINFVMDTEKRRGMSAVRTLSVTTLMRLIPPDQWILIPSIKYTLQKREKHRLMLLDTEEEVTEEENEEGGQLHPKIKALTPRKKARTRQKIDLRDDEPRPDDDEQKEEKSDADSKTKGKKGKDKKGKSKDKKGKKDKKKEKKPAKSKSPSKEKGKGKGKKGKKDKKSKKGGTTDDSGNESQPEKKGRLLDEAETPLPLLTPLAGSDTEIKAGQDTQTKDRAEDLIRTETTKQFKAYDLGKRHLITTWDDYHLFPLDGTVISYSVSTIEPDFRMMQLKVCKNGHETIFYPYYIPHNVNLSRYSYVLIPYFHTILANGTRITFKDKRAVDISKKVVQTEPVGLKKFNEENVLFMTESDMAMLLSKLRALRRSREYLGEFDIFEDEEEEEEEEEEETPMPVPEPTPEPEKPESFTSEKSDKGKKKKGKNDKSSDTTKSSDTSSKGKGKKDKKKKGKKESTPLEPELIVEEEREEEEVEVEEIQYLEEEGELEYQPVLEIEEPVGKWQYPSSDETEVDTRRMHQPSITSINVGWDEAEVMVKPMVHELKVTLPSGLYIEVNDVEGPPFSREVKQTYLTKGSAYAQVETCRYYTMDGSVVRFLTNGTVQIINARGITTNILEILAEEPPQKFDDAGDKLEKSEMAKVFRGDVIMPNGDFFHISNSRRTKRAPLYVFTSGTLPGGESFRRRQDGTMTVYGNDGCCITHYPDGTRFTTRMIVSEKLIPDFEDWVVVGMKYMIEHPNYAPVIFNTLSGNAHIRLPQGEWVRVFGDGSSRIAVDEDFKLDVDQYRAVTSCPPISHLLSDIPNLTVVKLYHFQGFLSASNSPSQTYTAGEWLGEDEYGEDAPPPYDLKRQLSKRQSFAGETTRGLMEQNLRPSIPAKHVAPTGKKASTKTAVVNEAEDEFPGEFPGEYEYLGEYDLPEVPVPSEMTSEQSKTKEPITTNPSVWCMEDTGKQFEVDSFLQFTDLWTLCKAIDSYDNRFAMDLFGNMIVDKGINYEEKSCTSTSDIVKELSNSFQLPKQTLSEMMTSSSKRKLRRKSKKDSLSKCPPAEVCDKRPKTRIFVVKRDLSGYEYLKLSFVNRMIKKAKQVPEAVVVAEPLPNKEKRKFITIMEPIRNCQNPHGIWKNNYREPVFRPRYLCNKDFRIARPDELRWFAQILANAHTKRGNYFLSPKEKYLKEKEEMLAKQQEALRLEEEAKAREAELEALRKLEEEEEGDNEEEEEELELSKKRKKKDSKKDSKKEKKDKKSTKGKGKKEKADKKAKGKKSKDKGEDKDEDAESEGKRKGSKKDKKEKTDGKKKKSKGKESVEAEPKEEEAEEEEEEEEGEEKELEGEIEIPFEITIPELPRAITKLGTQHPGDYPRNVSDVKGLYGQEPMDAVAVMPYQPEGSSPDRKTLVVRSIVEIPLLDDKLQDTLLMASQAYSKTQEAKKKLFEELELEGESLEERLIKRELFEDDVLLQCMSTLQQSAGKLLDQVL
ncbi:unnamed protein product [Allacma fusca]|uniref:Sperm-associated antigen 17 n=1 Tax=Allacma fusca TaxID=39272 RepID=A0A8J2LG52_9HEXA|nr:unnamed protein product [Allacma fusca]